MQKIAVLCAMLLTAACATAGVKVDQSRLTQFKVGETTYEQVIATLGQPTADTHTSDGQHIIQYTYAQVQARPESFIPVIGLFVAGNDIKATTVSVAFDNHDILKSYSTTREQYGRDTGLASH